MSGDGTIRVDQISEVRLLTPHSEPNFMILRITTRAGEVYNFGADRAFLTHAVRVWAFDLGAIESAIEAGAPVPGKQFGSADKPLS